MERVSVISGKLPVIIVAPHGYDGNDENTALVAESIDVPAVPVQAESMGASVVSEEIVKEPLEPSPKYPEIPKISMI